MNTKTININYEEIPNELNKEEVIFSSMKKINESPKIDNQKKLIKLNSFNYKKKNKLNEVKIFFLYLL